MLAKSIPQSWLNSKPVPAYLSDLKWQEHIAQFNLSVGKPKIDFRTRTVGLRYCYANGSSIKRAAQTVKRLPAPHILVDPGLHRGFIALSPRLKAVTRR
jgi:hypothetical protein